MTEKVNLEFNVNEDLYKSHLMRLTERLNKIYEGGGKKNAAKQKEKKITKKTSTQSENEVY